MMKFFFFFFVIKPKFWYYYKSILVIMFFFICMLKDHYFLLSKWFFLDLMSFILILLILWIFSLVILMSWNIYYLKFFKEFYVSLMKFLLVILLMVFSLINLLMFYLFYEISMIIMLFMILGFGFQYERLSSGFYMLFYTFFSSLLFLLSIFECYNEFLDLVMIYWMNMYFSTYFLVSLFLMFLVKLPMYLMHFWLPKVHVEASAGGSMILAGILLKLSGYGLVRVIDLIVVKIKYFSIYLVIFSLLSSILVSLLCLQQIDSKILIAYSSIVHMMFMMSGYFTLFKMNYLSLLVVMISHGLVSSGLFFFIGVIYERIFSRSMLLLKGFMQYYPIMSLFCFMLSVSNMSCPPSINFFGEIHIIMGLMNFISVSWLLVMFYIFFNVIYMLLFFSFIQFGKIYLLINKVEFFLLEYLGLFMHWLPVNFIFLIYLFIYFNNLQ